MLASGEITEMEMSFFVTGGFAVGEPPAKNPAADWLPEKSWGEMSRITDAVPIFAAFARSFRENLTSWKAYYDLLDPIDSPLPHPWETTLTPFQKLIVARMIRPDTVPIMVAAATKHHANIKKSGQLSFIFIYKYIDLFILIFSL